MRIPVGYRKILVVFVALALLLSLPAFKTEKPTAPRDSSFIAGERALSLLADLPLTFEANGGQADSRAKFISRSKHCNIALTDEGASFAFGGDAVKMNLISPGEARMIGAEEMAGRANYFLGSDPERWRAGVPLYAKVRYEQVYCGIDLVYYGRGRELEYDFIVAPGAVFREIRFRFDGAKDVRISYGELVVKTASGEIRNRKPLAYQESEGEKTEIEADYQIDTEGGISFRVGEYDSTKALVIDPILTFSTYLGGSMNDKGFAIAVDSFGKAYVAGGSESADFPTVSPVQASNKGMSDAFIARISTPGKISGASIRGKKLLVEGEGFDAGAVIVVDGQEQKTSNRSENPSGLLVSKKAARSIAPGQTVSIQARNSDGALSEAFRFTRTQ
jgi:hypothetical protein